MFERSSSGLERNETLVNWRQYSGRAGASGQDGKRRSFGPLEQDINGKEVVFTYAAIAAHQANIVENESIFVYKIECRDTNARSFHLVLVQFLSHENADENEHGYVMYVTRKDQVWNQPICGFERAISAVEDVADVEDCLAQFRAEGTVKIARVESKVSHGPERGILRHLFRIGQHQHHFEETYKYPLEIDADGYAIGDERDNASSGT